MLIEITSSSDRSRMPCTPDASRPIDRTSFSAKRMAWPTRDTIKTSSVPLECRTPTSSSPSRILIAIIPSALRFVLYASSFVFLTTPFFVAKSRYSASLKSRVWITARTCSPWRNGSRLTLARPERELVHLQAVDLADGGEEKDVVVRGGDEQVLDVVVLLHVHAHDADPAAPLFPVCRDGQSLDVARAGERDHHVLLRDQVFELELLLCRHDLRAAVVVTCMNLA